MSGGSTWALEHFEHFLISVNIFEKMGPGLGCVGGSEATCGCPKKTKV